MVSDLLIVSSHSYSCYDCDLVNISVFRSNYFFGSHHHPLSESHMLTTSVCRHTDPELISEYMHFSDYRSSIEYREKVRLSCEILRGNSKTQESEYRTISRIDILHEVFSSS